MICQRNYLQKKRSDKIIFLIKNYALCSQFSRTLDYLRPCIFSPSLKPARLPVARNFAPPTIRDRRSLAMNEAMTTNTRFVLDGPPIPIEVEHVLSVAIGTYAGKSQEIWSHLLDQIREVN